MSKSARPNAQKFPRVVKIFDKPGVLVVTLLAATELCLTDGSAISNTFQGSQAYGRHLRALVRYLKKEANGESGRWPHVFDPYPSLTMGILHSLYCLIGAYDGLNRYQGPQLNALDVREVVSFANHLMSRCGLHEYANTDSYEHLRGFCDAVRERRELSGGFSADGPKLFWDLLDQRPTLQLVGLLEKHPTQRTRIIQRAVNGSSLAIAHPSFFSKYETEGKRRAATTS